MDSFWPALCTLLALVFLLVLIIRYQMHAFAGLLAVSLGLGLAAGLSPERTVDAISKGVGDILRDVAILLALGAMLGRMLEVSGAAEVIAQTLVNTFGLRNAPLAILLTGFLVGIPVLFNVGFLLLMPIMWRLQRQTGQSLLYFMLPLAFSLGMTHSLVPPHPGIIGAVNVLAGRDPQTANQTMIETILFGSLMCLPLILLGWYGPGLWWARRQHVTAPEGLSLGVGQDSDPVPNSGQERNPILQTQVAPGAPPVSGAKSVGDIAQAPPSFFLAVLIVTLPLVLSLAGFGAKLFQDLGLLPQWMTEPPLEKSELPAYLQWLAHPPLAWLQFLGKPTMALLVPTALAFWFLGLRRGLRGAKLAKTAEEAIRDVGTIAFLFGAAGGFKEVIQATGAGDIIANAMMKLPLTPVATCYLVAVLMRVALGSATAAILTASALLAAFVQALPGQETLLVLAVANGVTFMTQPADSGFWMVKEFGNLSVRDVLLRFNACRITMSVGGFVVLLIAEAFLA
ncbi:MAG: GntP family permease [Gemmataceae bacterium]|nr:GntP family permease [Gemmataceae bacterium]MCI0738394.1 GntP family permease [Gemmataceae bacterium]